MRKLIFALILVIIAGQVKARGIPASNSHNIYTTISSCLEYSKKWTVEDTNKKSDFIMREFIKAFTTDPNDVEARRKATLNLVNEVDPDIVLKYIGSKILTIASNYPDSVVQKNLNYLLIKHLTGKKPFSSTGKLPYFNNLEHRERVRKLYKLAKQNMELFEKIDGLYEKSLKNVFNHNVFEVWSISFYKEKTNRILSKAKRFSRKMLYLKNKIKKESDEKVKKGLRKEADQLHARILKLIEYRKLVTACYKDLLSLDKIRSGLFMDSDVKRNFELSEGHRKDIMSKLELILKHQKSFLKNIKKLEEYEDFE